MSDPRPPRSTRPAAGQPFADRSDDDDDLPEPPRIRALRRLVTALTVASIVGVLTIAGALVVRIIGPFGNTALPPPPARIAAERIALPAGERITATGGNGPTLILATEAPDGTERLRIFDAATGAFLHAVTVTRD
jgi:hypothetical protein